MRSSKSDGCFKRSASKNYMRRNSLFCKCRF
jgi:hypothetical protein